MPVAHVAERRQRAEHVPSVLLGAVVAFDAPERGQHQAVDRKAALDCVEQRAPLLDLLLAAREAVGRDHAIDVVAERLAVFRLPLGGGDDARIGRDAAHREVEGGAGDALGLRVRPQFLDEGGEGRLSRVRAGAEENQHESQSEAGEHSFVSIRRCRYSSETKAPP